MIPLAASNKNNNSKNNNRCGTAANIAVDDGRNGRVAGNVGRDPVTDDYVAVAGNHRRHNPEGNAYFAIDPPSRDTRSISSRSSATISSSSAFSYIRSILGSRAGSFFDDEDDEEDGSSSGARPGSAHKNNNGHLDDQHDNRMKGSALKSSQFSFQKESGHQMARKTVKQSAKQPPISPYKANVKAPQSAYSLLPTVAEFDQNGERRRTSPSKRGESHRRQASSHHRAFSSRNEKPSTPRHVHRCKDATRAVILVGMMGMASNWVTSRVMERLLIQKKSVRSSTMLRKDDTTAAASPSSDVGMGGYIPDTGRFILETNQLGRWGSADIGADVAAAVTADVAAGAYNNNNVHSAPGNYIHSAPGSNTHSASGNTNIRSASDSIHENTIDNTMKENDFPSIGTNPDFNIDTIHQANIPPQQLTPPLTDRFRQLRKRLLSLYIETIPPETDDAMPSSVSTLSNNTISKSLNTIVHPLYNPHSPQYQALRWLADVDELQLLDADPGLIQRYSLAVLYFSTGGRWYMTNSQSNKDNNDDGDDGNDNNNNDKVGTGPWRNPTNFLSPTHECQWKGGGRLNAGGRGGGIRRCDKHNNVLEISIYNDLTGTIPSELGRLWSLQVLYLGRNHLSGTLPTELGMLNRLTSLSLHWNELSGTIPQQYWNNLVSLRSLQLEGNDGITGKIDRHGPICRMMANYRPLEEEDGNNRWRRLQEQQYPLQHREQYQQQQQQQQYPEQQKYPQQQYPQQLQQQYPQQLQQQYPQQLQQQYPQQLQQQYPQQLQQQYPQQQLYPQQQQYPQSNNWNLGGQMRQQQVYNGDWNQNDIQNNRQQSQQMYYLNQDEQSQQQQQQQDQQQQQNLAQGQINQQYSQQQNQIGNWDHNDEQQQSNLHQPISQVSQQQQWRDIGDWNQDERQHERNDVMKKDDQMKMSDWYRTEQTEQTKQTQRDDMRRDSTEQRNMNDGVLDEQQYSQDTDQYPSSNKHMDDSIQSEQQQLYPVNQDNGSWNQGEQHQQQDNDWNQNGKKQTNDWVLDEQEQEQEQQQQQQQQNPNKEDQNQSNQQYIMQQKSRDFNLNEYNQSNYEAQSTQQQEQPNIDLHQSIQQQNLNIDWDQSQQRMNEQASLKFNGEWNLNGEQQQQQQTQNDESIEESQNTRNQNYEQDQKGIQHLLQPSQQTQSREIYQEIQDNFQNQKRKPDQETTSKPQPDEDILLNQGQEIGEEGVLPQNMNEISTDGNINENQSSPKNPQTMDGMSMDGNINDNQSNSKKPNRDLRPVRNQNGKLRHLTATCYPPTGMVSGAFDRLECECCTECFGKNDWR